MNKKSIFTQTVMVILLVLVCVFLTVMTAFLFGSVGTDIFDFKNLNYSNFIPVLIIGGIISCFVVGIAVLFVARSAFFKVKDYLNEKENDNDGGNKK